MAYVSDERTNQDTPKHRLQINPEPLKLVPAEHRWAAGLKGARTREQQKRIWVALGGDPGVWEDEHPKSWHDWPSVDR